MWETHSQEFYDSEDDLDERVSFYLVDRKKKLFLKFKLTLICFLLWSRLAHCPKTAPLFHRTGVVEAPLPAGAPPVVPMVEQEAGLVKPTRI